MNPVIRLLTKADGPQYQTLRLKSLQTDPQSFLATFDGESTKHEQAFADELDMAYSPPHFGVYGVFVEEKLAGYAQVQRSTAPKQAHIAYLFNLYLDPTFRGQGLSRKLFDHVFNQLKTEGIEQLYLTCLASNTAARQLYRKLGFHRHGTRRQSVKWQGQYDDEVEYVYLVQSPRP
jgi:RimJ/RimL family protein N-acetyltransferase